MSRPSEERIAYLETRIVEQDRRMADLERRASRRSRLGLPRLSLARRLTIAFVALVLAIPAGVVLANHQFSDVPTGHAFHSDVNALVNSGVTSGCGGGKFCPDANVTRGQMAAFLNRLGALSPEKTPVVNADRLDGLHANELVRVASFGTGATTALGGTLIPYGSDLVITAPTAGFVTVNYGVTLWSGDCTSACLVTAVATHVESGLTSVPAQAWVSSTVQYASASIHWVVRVNAGVNTFRLLLNRSAGNGTIYGWYATGNALFTPFGSTGGSTLSLDGAATQTHAQVAKEMPQD